LKLAEQFAVMAGQKLPEEKVINEAIEGDFIVNNGVIEDA